MLSRIVEARSNPRAFRSSVTSAMPSLKASVGELMTAGSPSIAISPPRQPRAAPKIDSRISVRPDPSSPPMPRISPRRRSKLTPCRTRRQPRGLTVSSVRSRTDSTGAPSAAMSSRWVGTKFRPTIAEMIAFDESLSIGAVRTRRPSRSTVTRSASATTSSMRCEVKMIATPAAASWRTTLNSVSHSDVDSAEVGSSIIRIRASSDSALAISTSCCSPTRSSATRLCGSMSMPSRRSSAVRRLGDPAPIDDRPGDQRLASEEDVVGRRQFGNEIELLMNDRDARALGVLHARELHRRARQPDDAVVLDVHAGEDLHQRALAGAVLADQRMHFAGLQVEVDVDQRRDSAERFGDAQGFEDDAVAPRRHLADARSPTGARSG